MRLDAVDWDAALAELSGGPPRALAEALSLSAAGATDLPLGLVRVAEAERLEPLNPIHRYRRGLLYLRFGLSEAALAALDELPEALRGERSVAYARALAMLQRGEWQRARNIAGELAEADAAFVPARFLALDVQARIQLKGIDAKVAELPREPAWAASWSDLLIKLLVARPKDVKSVRQHLGARRVLAHDPAAAALVERAIAWCEMSGDELAAELERTPEGAPAETMIALLWSLKTEDDDRVAACRRLHDRLLGRGHVRRVLVAALTQAAVQEAARDRHEHALRLVEACLRLEPHEAIHHQNRAALFTLLGRWSLAAEAWAGLDRHHYRCALVGRLDAAAAESYAQPHRMAAQQARLTPAARRRQGGQELGVFRVEESRDGDMTRRRLVVNQERIDLDPDQLRQWVHHRSAELVFGHLALGESLDAVLLSPSSPAEADERVDALLALTSSLGVLVDGEGEELSARLGRRWRALRGEGRMRYAEELPVGAARELASAYLETLGDLVLLSMWWSPDGRRPDLVDEVERFLRAAGAFFDERLLEELVKKRDPGAADALPLLRDLTASVLELSPEEDLALDPEGRRCLIEYAVAQLRVGFVQRCFQDTAPDDARIEALLEMLDLAREGAPKDVMVELWAATLAFTARLDDEARQAIARYRLKNQHPEDRRDEQIERLHEALAQRRQDGQKGRARAGGGALAIASDDEDVDRLEAELEQHASSVHLYEELVRLLAARGDFDEAEARAEQAVARCLGRRAQSRARVLLLETLGLRRLAAASAEAARVYFAGSRAGAAAALDSLPATDDTSALAYVRGRSMLAARRHDDARAAFERALAGCDRALFLPVLRPLARSMDPVLMEAVRDRVEDAMRDERYADAFAAILDALPDLDEPARALLDLADVQIGSAVAAASTGRDALVALPEGTPVSALLRQVFGEPDPFARAERLIEEAKAALPDAGLEVRRLERRLATVRDKVRVARALEASGRLLADRKWDEALAALDGVEGDARIDRQRVVLLLRLERFEEADALASQLAAERDPVARTFSERYPRLRYTQRLATARRLLDERRPRDAGALLAATEVPDGEPREPWLTLRVACAVAQAEAAAGEGDEAAERRALIGALELLDAMSGDAEAAGLRERLEARLERTSRGAAE